MSEKKKKFEACLLRDEAGEFIVAQWNQLVTTIDKSKLTVGSSVGYKKSTNKREKIVRGTIVVIGSLRLCEQQMKFFKEKNQKKKVEAKEFDDNEEVEKEDDDDEEVDASNDKDSADFNDENSSDSSDECLEIDTQEEIHVDEGSKTVEVERLKVVNEKNKSQSIKTVKSSSNGGNNREQIAGSSTQKQVNSDVDDELPPPKRSKGYFARMEELKLENTRLKNQNDKYRNEWMPRPTDPAVIRYFIRMGALFSSNGEDEDKKADKLDKICTLFGMDENELCRLQKPNGTKTARALVRAFYPLNERAGITPDDIQPAVREAIHDYVNLFHGMEGLSEGKINESINNVFRSAKSQQKEKNEKQQPISSNSNTSKTISKKKIIVNDKENNYLKKR